MNGCDRRAEPACPCHAARESPCAAGRVNDPDRCVQVMERPHGHPLGVVTATGRPGDTAGPRQAPVAAVHRDEPRHRERRHRERRYGERRHRGPRHRVRGSRFGRDVRCAPFIYLGGSVCLVGFGPQGAGGAP
jgi:hypothetical protein